MELYIQEEQISEHLQKRLERFRADYPVADEVKRRVSKPDMPFFGKEILEMAVSALLEGENILLCGDKATGKNILAENLAWMFGRPVYNMSFHVNTDSGSLIGSDTFVDNEVKLRKGPVYQCAAYGGFGILDEINMAKTTPSLFFTLRWITAVSSMCRAMTGSSFIPPPALSAQ